MDEVIQFIIAVIFIGVALAFKLMEMASRKKMPLPLPELPPEEEIFEEIEPEPKPKIEIKPIIKEPRPVHKPKILEPEYIGFPIGELQKGIILSTILGPPKALTRRKSSMR